MSQTFTEFLRQLLTEERLQRFDEVLAHRTRRFTPVLENIYHAHNASACLRTCDCLGIQDVHIVEARNSFQPNQDIALGASKWLTIHRYRGSESAPHSATADCFQHLRQQGYRILATSPRQDSCSLTDISTDGKTAVVFGAEQLGVSDYAISEADGLIHVPMFGFTESFNISVSLALIAQHFCRDRQDSDDDRGLSDQERDDILHDWVCRTLGPKLEPLRRRYQADYPSAQDS